MTSLKLILCVTLLCTSACQKTENDKTSGNVSIKAAPSLDSTQALDAYLINGNKVIITLDSCDFNGEGWEGSSDPLGSIKCGEAYTVGYDAVTGEWMAEGLNEGSSHKESTRVIDKLSKSGNAPLGGVLNVWGATFKTNDDMTVRTRKQGTVGRLAPANSK